MFFWVGIFIIKPILELRSAFTSRTPFGWAISLGIMALCILIGQFLYKEDQRALPLLKAFLILELIFAQLFLLDAWMSYRDGEKVFYPHAPVIDGIRIAFYVAIWWLYFRYSVRVRNTFGRNL